MSDIKAECHKRGVFYAANVRQKTQKHTTKSTRIYTFIYTVRRDTKRASLRVRGRVSALAGLLADGLHDSLLLPLVPGEQIFARLLAGLLQVLDVLLRHGDVLQQIID